jgi:hypothetical protein
VPDKNGAFCSNTHDEFLIWGNLDLNLNLNKSYLFITLEMLPEWPTPEW